MLQYNKTQENNVQYKKNVTIQEKLNIRKYKNIFTIQENKRKNTIQENTRKIKSKKKNYKKTFYNTRKKNYNIRKYKNILQYKKIKEQNYHTRIHNKNVTIQEK